MLLWSPVVMLVGVFDEEESEGKGDSDEEDSVTVVTSDSTFVDPWVFEEGE